MDHQADSDSRLSPFDLEAIGGEEGIEAVIEQAKESAEGMQSEIDDRLVESNWHGEVRVVIEDSAGSAAGVLKGPYPVKRTTRLVRRENGSVASVNVTEIKARIATHRPVGFLPDGSCGESSS